MVSIAQIQEFTKVAKNIEFRGASKKEKYAWIEEVLLRFRYVSLRKKEKSILKEYVMRMTGYAHAQIQRLMRKKKKTGKVLLSSTRRHTFTKRYTAEDIARLIETDTAHSCLSGKATKHLFERAFTVFEDQRFKRLKGISVSHLYNLRGTRQYQSNVRSFTKTKPTQIPIGERRKPDPHGEPGYLRVDTVHQGDRENEKGVYHINLVDEVTQWEIVGAVEHISEQYLQPILEAALAQFPFRIQGFHSDNGSEYINQVVARLLNKLLIRQTKSRPRHSGDNGLVESKNGSVVRKHMGHMHIPQTYAAAINGFYLEYLNLYLNYHRPSGFAEVKTDRKGKEKKVYNLYQTPYEAFKRHINASNFLKEGISFEKLDILACAKSDNEYAILMQQAKTELFKSFHHHLNS